MVKKIEENLDQISAIIREAAEFELLPRFGKLAASEIMTKGKNDVVTVADFESEHRIKNALREAFPDVLMIGEEEASKSPEILNNLNADGQILVVDPLDGTKNFASNKPCFAIIMALIENGETTAGWIYDPVANVMITAVKGRGAWVSGRQLFMPQDIEITSMTACVGPKLAKRMGDMKNAPNRHVRYGCAGREYMDLALGKINFTHYGGRLMAWDHAAGALICSEAGGVAMFSPKDGAFEQYSPIADPAGRHLLIGPNRAAVEKIHNMVFTPIV